MAQLSLSAPEGSGDIGGFRQRTKSGVEPPHSTGCCLNPKRLIFTEVAVTMKLISRYRYSSLLLAALALSALMLWWGIPRAGSLAQIEIKKGSKKPAPKPAPKPETKPSAPVRRSAPEIEMVYVTGGSFLMGSPENEPDRSSDEGPQHRVTVQSFYIGKYEVTQAQWRAVMGSNPSYLKGDNLPVENVSWNDAKEFCRKLSQMTGKEYRLPTEAEWEYACRAKTTGAYAGDLDAMAWYSKNSDPKTHPVGQRQPNAFGIYDMHGNVWEWCSDWYSSSYYAECERQGTVTDPQGPSTGSYRVSRGGGWYSYAVRCRSAIRNNGAPGYRIDSLGCRLVRVGR